MEIETRARIKNLDDIEQKIIKLGGGLIKEKEQMDEYFGEIKLYQKIGYSFLMRVRDEGDKKFLTYKGAKLKKDGIWEEYEFEIDDTKKAAKMLRDMGLEKIIVVKKRRKTYALDGLTLCLDHIQGLGSFIEIECLDSEDFNKRKIRSLMQRLGIKKDQLLDKGYVTMLLARNNSPYSKYILN